MWHVARMDIKNCIRIYIEKHEGNTLVRRHRLRYENNISIDFIYIYIYIFIHIGC
jgi:hypothetical protein